MSARKTEAPRLSSAETEYIRWMDEIELDEEDGVKPAEDRDLKERPVSEKPGTPSRRVPTRRR